MTRCLYRRFASPALGMVAAAVVVASCGPPGGSSRAAARAAASSAGTTASTVGVTVPATDAPTSPTTPAAPTTTTVAVPTTTAAPAVRAATAPATAQAAACPQNLASSLAYTGSAGQLITAEGAGYGATVAAVQLWQRNGGCWVSAGGPWSAHIGQNGFSDHPIEGDGTSPVGAFGIGPVIYGNAPNPGVRGQYHHLVCGDWWDEDPSSAQYNTFQPVQCGTTPSWANGSEALWTETKPYPSFAVIDYNTDPAVPYAGSGVFIAADTGTPTDGCVSLGRPQLDQLLRWLNPAASPLVVMGPASEMTRF